MQYYGNQISENISRREPEGYLLCLNVPVARTGMQEYLPEELGLGSGPGFIQVYRPEEEVFAPETMASFEAVPVTNDHPRDGVDLDNIRRLQAGHAQNVRRGSGEEADLLLADLVITDERLIEAILGGKREISCGYTYELAEENGRYIQRKIRGNHIAVVDAGRAGLRVSIKDHIGSKGKAPGAPFPMKEYTQNEEKGFHEERTGKDSGAAHIPSRPVIRPALTRDETRIAMASAMKDAIAAAWEGKNPRVDLQPGGEESRVRERQGI